MGCNYTFLEFSAGGLDKGGTRVLYLPRIGFCVRSETFRDSQIPKNSVDNLKAFCLLITAPLFLILRRAEKHVMSSKKQSCENSHGPAEASLPIGESDLKFLENKSMASMKDALSAVRELSAARVDAKLSVSRLAGVARELRELIKVMSIYGC